MKKIFFLIAAIIYSLTTLGQQVVLKDAVSIDLPQGTQKITKQQALDHVGTKFNKNSIVLNSVSSTNSKYIYKIDDVLITLFNENKSVKEGHLLELKNGLDEMNKSNSTYTSNIKKINNNPVLIMNYIAENIECYRFFCYNINNSRAITGVLEFNIADKDKAATILNHILNNITFKD